MLNGKKRNKIKLFGWRYPGFQARFSNFFRGTHPRFSPKCIENTFLNYPASTFRPSQMQLHLWAVLLTNRPQSSMVYTLIDHTRRNDVMKCSKLKWNHEPQVSGFTARVKFCTLRVKNILKWSTATLAGQFYMKYQKGRLDFFYWGNVHQLWLM